jgi:hypothetical protein
VGGVWPGNCLFGRLWKSVAPVYGSDAPGTDASNLVSQLVGLPLLYLALLTVPVTLTISILRYRLYDIDIIINRTLVYVPVTAIVAGLFTASQRLLVSLTAGPSLPATVLSTLMVAALLTPVKDRIQKRVDRHFKDAPNPSKKLNLFAEHVRSRLFAVDVPAGYAPIVGRGRHGIRGNEWGCISHERW